MQLRTVVFTAAGQCYQTFDTTGKYPEYDTLDKAKKAVSELLANTSYKPYFQQGYDAFILNMENGAVVSRAKVEAPSLNWKDAS